MLEPDEDERLLPQGSMGFLDGSQGNGGNGVLHNTLFINFQNF